MKLKPLLFSALLSLTLTFFPLTAGNVLALTFNPSFGVLLSSNDPGANSDVTLTITQDAGDEVLSSVKFTVPAGWDMTPGSSFAQDAVLATGTFTAFVPGFGSVTSTITIKNDLDLQGHKAHWKVQFVASGAPTVTLDSFVDGTSLTGHTFTVSRAFLATIESPIDLTVVFNGMVEGTPAWTNPTVQGDYTWNAEYTAPSGAQVTRSQTLSIPGTVTSVGDDVNVSLNNGSSVVFSSVTTEGVTTIATSTTPPPEGSGQFQLSGGLYYDFNTTAVFSCPCTVTLPYDPATTPDPRIYHQESGVWTDVTTAVDTVNHTVTGVVSSFSFFAVGEPNFSVAWQKKVEKLLDRQGNPFELDENDNLKIRFGLLDFTSQPKTPDNVSVEIWQTKDAAGADITPTQVLTLDPKLNEKKEYYEAKLNQRKTSLELGTYQIRIVVSNTTATQTPETAGFTLFEK